jgi:predicted Na+-dependent transporter
MEALRELIPLVFALSLFLLVLNIGLDATLSGLLSVLRTPDRLLTGILAVNVLVPLAAIALVRLIPISTVAAAGVLLMSISPAPPLAPGKGLKVGCDKDYVYGLYAALILLAAIVVPIWVKALDLLYTVKLTLPLAAVARNVALTVLVPLALGLLGRRFAPRLASKATQILPKVAMAALVAATVPIVALIWPALVALAGDGTLLVMALTAAAALAVGHLLGGPAREDRAALAVMAATRHPGIALIIASTNIDDPRVKAAIIGFLLVGMAVTAPYQLWVKRSRLAPAL